MRSPLTGESLKQPHAIDVRLQDIAVPARPIHMVQLVNFGGYLDAPDLFVTTRLLPAKQHSGIERPIAR